jgi:anti-anti-sigma factor
MRLTFRRREDVIVFVVEGDVIGPDGERLLNEFRNALRLSGGQGRFVLNLRRTNMMDSSAIGALVQVYTEAARAPDRVRVALTNPPDPLERLFELARIFDLFPRGLDEEDAIAHLA